MDLSTIANLAEAFAVIVAVSFGMVQLCQLNAQRRREAAFTLMHSIQSPQMLGGILIIDRLQICRPKPRLMPYQRMTRSI